MKKNVRTLIMLLSFTSVSLITTAQEKESIPNATPKWIPENGYWVIENNIKSPKTNIVRFYNNDKVLVYTEKVEGVRLNLNKKQTCMRLKKALDKSLIAWEKMQPANDQLVKAVFKIKE